MAVVMKIASVLALCAVSFRVKRRQQATATKDITTARQQYRVHIPGGTQSCEAVMFNVGTGMSVGKYDKMATALANEGFIVAIVDPEKGSMTKLDEAKAAAAYVFAKENMVSWSDGACTSISKWIAGGHSAGGGSGYKAVARNHSLAHGIFSVDPFARGKPTDEVNLPSLYWGFDVTTCFVTKEDAAAAYYDKTTGGKRVFARVHKEYAWSSCGYSPKWFHCSIADDGCTGCTNCADTPDSFYTDVADSVRKFSNHFSTSSWSAEVLGMKSTNMPVDWIVD